MLLDIDKNL